MTYLSKDTGIPGLMGLSYPKMPHGGVPFLYEVSFLVNTILSLCFLIPLAIIRRTDVVYGHNNECGFSAILLSKLLGIRSIVDLHGVEVDEYLEQHADWKPNGIRMRFWRSVEKFVLRYADEIVCVSKVHREVLKGRFDRIRVPVVIPCFADEQLFSPDNCARATTRSKLNIGETDIVFVYTGVVSKEFGGFNPIHFVSRIEDLAGKHLLIVSANESISRAESQVPAFMKGKVTVLTSPRHEVPRYLCASDIGILLRKENVVNEVASPTKFPEYLLCGLPVVVTDRLGDASAIVKSSGAGLCLSSSRIGGIPSLYENEISNLSAPGIRARARAAGDATLSRRVHKPAFLKLLLDQV
jgi:glycosyltransferase involved in cell wall biosynthesis